MNARLVNRVIFPLHEWVKGKPTHRWLRHLEVTQWLSAEALRELQVQKLRRHLEFAYREVPYYTRLFDEHGVRPATIQSVDDLARIPCLTKEIIRARFEDLQPRRRRPRGRPVRTGGSTGIPVAVMVDRQRMAFTDATRLRAHRWFDVDMGAREVVLWGSPLELTKQDWLRSLRDRLTNSRLISAFDLGGERLARYADLLSRERPQKLYGYASALHRLAEHLIRTGWRPGPDWPRAVFTTAETLYDFQRAAIEAAFGCPVAVEYGGRESGLIAHQCPAGGLHIAGEGIVVEALPTGAGGDEIVVTHLESYAMPLIRYRSGDVGTLEERPCACGRGLPCLRSLEGRQTDFLVTPSGKVMHGLAIIYILRELPGVEEFQVIQARRDRITVRVVPGAAFTASVRAVLLAQTRRAFGSEVEITLDVVSVLPLLASGKRRYVISHVHPEEATAHTPVPR